MRAGLTALFVKFPPLSIWPFRQIITLAMEKYGDMCFNAAAMELDLFAITQKNQALLAQLNKSTVALKIIAQVKGVDSPEFKAARENAKEALVKFVSFGS